MIKNNNGKSFKRKWLGLLLVATLGIAAVGCSSTTPSDSGDGTTKTEDKKEEKAQTRDNSTAKETTLAAGTFYVGEDVPVGRYVVSGDSTGNFFVYDKSGMPKVNEILGTDGFGVETVTINLEEGQKIEISGINNVKFVPAETKMLSELSSGSWEVGLDVEPGRYIASVDEGTGNFFVYRKGLPKVNEILDASAGMGVQNVTIELEKGDVIQINGLEKVKLEKK